MKKKEIKKKYNDKIKLIKKYNFSYYDKSSPIVNDQIYDNLKQEILQLEIDYTFLKSDDSPSKIIGYKPSKNFKKVPHKVPMLSLGNAFDERDLVNFVSVQPFFFFHRVILV